MPYLKKETFEMLDLKYMKYKEIIDFFNQAVRHLPDLTLFLTTPEGASPEHLTLIAELEKMNKKISEAPNRAAKDLIIKAQNTIVNTVITKSQEICSALWRLNRYNLVTAFKATDESLRYTGTLENIQYLQKLEILPDTEQPITKATLEAYKQRHPHLIKDYTDSQPSYEKFKAEAQQALDELDALYTNKKDLGDWFKPIAEDIEDIVLWCIEALALQQPAGE